MVQLNKYFSSTRCITNLKGSIAQTAQFSLNGLTISDSSIALGTFKAYSSDIIDSLLLLLRWISGNNKYY